MHLFFLKREFIVYCFLKMLTFLLNLICPHFHCAFCLVGVSSSHRLSFKTLQEAVCREQWENQFDRDNRRHLSSWRSTRLICLGRIWQLHETIRQEDTTATIEMIDLC